ncbi:MAG: magnesium transporter [Deltaproteobacteria bacterium]|nr:magnesium transporter [Deltaproteobacteria bacterium]
MAVEEKHLPVEELKESIEREDLEGVKKLIAPLHPTDVAAVLKGLEGPQVTWVFRLLKKDVASAVLLELDDRMRELLVASVSSGELAQLVGEMESDDATDIVGELPLAEANEVLAGIDKEDARKVQKLLAYPEDTAGGKMQAELVSVRETATVREAIEEVRRKSKEIDNISNVFVVDSEGRFSGSVALNKLILAEEDGPIKGITDTKAVKVTTDVDQEQVAKMFQRYDLLNMPVVDKNGRLVGRITIDDIVDVIEEEISEDFYRVASLNIGERVLDSAGRSFGMRAPWLLINLATAFIAAAVVKVFESTIGRLVILAVFMPIVAGMGGNAATQTIAVVVRGLALGELPPNSARKVLIKEVLVGLANGILTGIVAMGVSYILGANPMVGLLLFLAMMANLVIAGFSGTIIPLALKWWGADPALASSIFVTTCTDVGGFLSFLGLAAVFMRAGIL